MRSTAVAEGQVVILRPGPRPRPSSKSLPSIPYLQLTPPSILLSTNRLAIWTGQNKKGGKTKREKGNHACRGQQRASVPTGDRILRQIIRTPNQSLSLWAWLDNH
ncbi:hypothetical protein Cob_v013001 [Colletotrichum orbiculare MAFF 240422]|uniref:Uncharacterized protein n=1 Tax=Colletotrichum orbiculare (strain 104-T / ATCC 96160 / CBS 514.97 / LARS 414 / MAFF 240422) TaxID=1213857 RepID=A0A484FAL6_COLOR|nr:hypothetical protein Cob_v013001 [Colletotrichum orbiculare MAFF 240422]